MAYHRKLTYAVGVMFTIVYHSHGRLHVEFHREVGGYDEWLWKSETGKRAGAVCLDLYAVSGLALLFLALGHLLIMHIIHDVGTIDFQFVAARYATPFGGPTISSCSGSP